MLLKLNYIIKDYKNSDLFFIVITIYKFFSGNFYTCINNSNT